MKRDNDLVREILRRVEEHDELWSYDVDGYDEVVVARHIQLLQDHDLVEAYLFDTDSDGVIRARVDRLTWSGHEFLDAARNDHVWAKAKDVLAEKGISVPLSVLQELLVKLVSSVALGG